MDLHNRILWFLLIPFFWYVIVFSSLDELMSYLLTSDAFRQLTAGLPDTNGILFVAELYLSTLPGFIGAFLLTGIIKRNRSTLEKLSSRTRRQPYQYTGKGCWSDLIVRSSAASSAL